MSVDNFRNPKKPQSQDKDEYFGPRSMNELLKLSVCPVKQNCQKLNKARLDDEKDLVSDDNKTLENDSMQLIIEELEEEVEF